MRKSIRMAVIGGTAAVLVAGGSTAAFAATHDGHDRSDARTPAPTAAVKVSRSQAEAIATQRYPGARVTETEFEPEHGRQFWTVDLVKQRREFEVTVDAVTGKVVTAHQDDGDHGRHDGSDDHGEHHDHHDDD